MNMEGLSWGGVSSGQGMNSAKDGVVHSSVCVRPPPVNLTCCKVAVLRGGMIGVTLRNKTMSLTCKYCHNCELQGWGLVQVYRARQVWARHCTTDKTVLASTTFPEGCAVTVPLGPEFLVGAVWRSMGACRMSICVSRWESD